MKRFLFAALAALCVAPAFAVDVSSDANTSWTNPTLGCPTVNGVPTGAPCTSPLTGADVLQAIDIYVSTSAIPDNFAGQPTLSVTGGAQTAKVTVTVPNDSTLHIRLKARNATGVSTFTTEVTKLVHVDVGATPLPPTNVTFELVIRVPDPPAP